MAFEVFFMCVGCGGGGGYYIFMCILYMYRISVYINDVFLRLMISTQQYSFPETFVYIWNNDNEVFEGKNYVIRKSEEIKDT